MDCWCLHWPALQVGLPAWSFKDQLGSQVICISDLSSWCWSTNQQLSWFKSNQMNAVETQLQYVSWSKTSLTTWSRWRWSLWPPFLLTLLTLSILPWTRHPWKPQAGEPAHLRWVIFYIRLGIPGWHPWPVIYEMPNDQKKWKMTLLGVLVSEGSTQFRFPIHNI